MSSRRLNITLPEQFDELLEALSVLSGRSKASYVLDALKYSVPHFQRDLGFLRGAKLMPDAGASPKGGPSVPVGEGRAVKAAPVQRSERGMPAGLGRQARKRWAREHPKGTK